MYLPTTAILTRLLGLTMVSTNLPQPSRWGSGVPDAEDRTPICRVPRHATSGALRRLYVRRRAPRQPLFRKRYKTSTVFRAHRGRAVFQCGKSELVAASRSRAALPRFAAWALFLIRALP